MCLRAGVRCQRNFIKDLATHGDQAHAVPYWQGARHQDYGRLYERSGAGGGREVCVRAEARAARERVSTTSGEDGSVGFIPDVLRSYSIFHYPGFATSSTCATDFTPLSPIALSLLCYFR